MEEKIYLAALHKIGISHKKFHIIFNNKNNYKQFYESLNFSILKKFNFSDKQINYILTNKKDIKLNYLENKLIDREVKIITINDNKYPDLLKEIPNKPYLFYLRGDINNSPKISVVGSRKITKYGEKSINSIVGSLSNYFTIVSGGASGCDTQAHKISINKGTISVIGTGIDIDYPVSNKKLYDNIVNKGGAILSIFPIGEVGNSYNFPVRNEIVAGLSLGVLIIEAKKRSGTLITANLALDLGKDLFAIPGDIYSETSEGCNNLVKNGNAKLISKTQDILDDYNIIINNNIKVNKTKFSDKIEEEIYNSLLIESFNTDEISKKFNISLKKIILKLSIMEIKSIIKKGIGGKYEII